MSQAKEQLLKNHYDKMVELVWAYLNHVNGHRDRRQTAWGAKTKKGLAECFKQMTEES